MSNLQRPSSETHRVFNQVPDLVPYNAYLSDPTLQHMVDGAGAGWAHSSLEEYGARVGSNLHQAGIAANRELPVLRSHDRRGVRVDQVEFHPSYHRLMEAAISSGWPTLPWVDSRPGAHTVRAAMAYLHHQADSGTGCPLTMTFASLPVIRSCPELARVWEPLICSGQYDPDDRPVTDKKGATVGMGMTEKQGGTDVRANETRATPLGRRGSGEAYELTGHKWFLSAPMCDAFLVLAQAPDGLGCFLMPRWRAVGERNQLYIQRLKDKMGNRSNASSEIEFRGALAWLIGEEGRGVATILEMVGLTRFDCVVGSAGLMRQALVQAIHHCRHRTVLGDLLIDKPLMQNVLASQVVDAEAALALGMRLAAALDKKGADLQEKSFFRVATAIGKYWVCRRAPLHILEAMECLGGNAYVEESVLPRLYREAPVNAIWEGSSNVQCLDVLRTVQKDPTSLDLIVNEIERAKGLDNALDNHLLRLKNLLANRAQWEFQARQLVENLVLGLQGSLLLCGTNSDAAEAFCRLNLSEHRIHMYGGLLDSARSRQLIEGSFSS